LRINLFCKSGAAAGWYVCGDIAVNPILYASASTVLVDNFRNFCGKEFSNNKN